MRSRTFLFDPKALYLLAVFSLVQKWIDVPPLYKIESSHPGSGELQTLSSFSNLMCVIAINKCD